MAWERVRKGYVHKLPKGQLLVVRPRWFGRGYAVDLIYAPGDGDTVKVNPGRRDPLRGPPRARINVADYLRSVKDDSGLPDKWKEDFEKVL